MPSLQIANLRPTDMVVSPDGALLYASFPDGYIRVYNLATGALVNSWLVGGNLGGIDVSADGSFLLVTDRTPISSAYADPWWNSSSQVATHRVSTANGAVTNYNITLTAEAYSFQDIAILADGTALITQNILPGWSGWGRLWSLNLSTGTYSPFSSSYYQGPSLTMSRDDTRAVLGELNLSSANSYLYQQGSGLIASHGTYQDNVFGYAAGVEAYTKEAGYFVHASGGHLYVYNGLLQYIRDLTTTLPGLSDASGLAFSASGRSLFVVDAGDDTIVEISTNTWTVIQTLSIGADAGMIATAGAELIADDSGRFLIVMSNAGVWRVDNPLPANAILGTNGADVLIGTAGADFLAGLQGDDIYLVDHAEDLVMEAPNEGRDTVRSSTSYVLRAGVSVEVLETGDEVASTQINLTGNELANTIVGNAAGNLLSGGAGNDIIYGRDGNDSLVGGTGNDVLAGGRGDDIYFVDSTGDETIEYLGEGRDSVYASLSYGLGTGAYVEALFADPTTGTAAINLSGNELANSLYGNAGANFLRGYAGNDVLIAYAGNDTLDGGTDNDTMAGGLGDDIYFVDSPGDEIIENPGEGRDVVYTSFSYGLGNGMSLEVLYADPGSGTAAINLFGNELDNTLYGNAGNNGLVGNAGNDILIGYAGNDTLNGGAGNDIMAGGPGDDIYIVDSIGDDIAEYANEGRDIVYASVSYGLAAGASIEQLLADPAIGAAAINLAGNELANTIQGNGGTNFLSGGGGADTLIAFAGDDTLNGGTGADVMVGGVGNDVYIVDNAGDDIVELDGEGLDSVYASVSYALSSSARVERLLVDPASGVSPINLTGNFYSTVLQGGAGNNILTGGRKDDTLYGFAGDDTLIGGWGSNILYGGAGNDVFAMTTPQSANDTIMDFTRGEDRISLLGTAFNNLPVGALAASSFTNFGTAPTTSNPTIVYDAATGALYFDADGNGAGGLVQFATLANVPALTAADFFVA